MLVSLHKEGYLLYRTVVPSKEYYTIMDAWTQRARDILNRHFPVSDVYRFEHSQFASMHFNLPDDADPNWQKETHNRRGSYSGQINALKNLIEFPTSFLLIDYELVEEVLRDGDVLYGDC